MKTGVSLWEKLHREKEAIRQDQIEDFIKTIVKFFIMLESWRLVVLYSELLLWISGMVHLISYSWLILFLQSKLIFRKKYCHNLGDFVEQKTLNTVARYFIQIHVLFEIFWFLFIVAPCEEWLLYSTAWSLDGAVNYRAISTLQLQGNIKSPLSIKSWEAF